MAPPLLSLSSPPSPLHREFSPLFFQDTDEEKEKVAVVDVAEENGRVKGGDFAVRVNGLDSEEQRIEDSVVPINPVAGNEVSKGSDVGGKRDDGVVMADTAMSFKTGTVEEVEETENAALVDAVVESSAKNIEDVDITPKASRVIIDLDSDSEMEDTIVLVNSIANAPEPQLPFSLSSTATSFATSNMGDTIVTASSSDNDKPLEQSSRMRPSENAFDSDSIEDVIVVKHTSPRKNKKVIVDDESEEEDTIITERSVKISTRLRFSSDANFSEDISATTSELEDVVVLAGTHNSAARLLSFRKENSASDTSSRTDATSVKTKFSQRGRRGVIGIISEGGSAVNEEEAGENNATNSSTDGFVSGKGEDVELETDEFIDADEEYEPRKGKGAKGKQKRQSTASRPSKPGKFVHVAMPPRRNPSWTYKAYSTEVDEKGDYVPVPMKKVFPVAAKPEMQLMMSFVETEPVQDDGSIWVAVEGWEVIRNTDSRMKDEYIGLYELSATHGVSTALLSGWAINSKGQRFRLHNVEIDQLSIGGYLDLDQHTVGDQVWVHPKIKFPHEIWYHLKRASNLYQQEYFDDFIWLANASKHFVDFLSYHEGNVCLANFKEEFHAWMEEKHGKDKDFREWRAKYPHRDFRHLIIANSKLFYNQSVNTQSNLRSHQIWTELNLEALKEVPGKMIMSTVTTPMVHDIFADVFGKNLLRVEPKTIEYGKFFPGETQTPDPIKVPRDDHGNIRCTVNDVKVGDVVAVLPDGEGSGSKWKDKSEYWFAYIHRIYKDRKGRDVAGVIWLYTPEHTLLKGSHYPYKNELFFSTHCNCQENAYVDSALLLEDIQGIYPCKFFGGPEEKGFFCRLRHDIETGFWVTLKESNLTGCPCTWKETSMTDYERVVEDFKEGDTILYEVDGHLEPAVIEQFLHDDMRIKIRLFLRFIPYEISDMASPPYAPNEVIYRDQFKVIKPSLIYRGCRMLFIEPEKQIPTPFDREGTGDCFFVRYREKEDGTLAPYPFDHKVRTNDISLNPPRPPLVGLDLFCGGGNFGRGIEEGGAVINKWAVDLFTAALCTYHANNRHEAHMYLGSVNNFLKDAMEGRYLNGKIAKPGEVGFISAGSPCQGFSNANPDKNSEKSNSNASLVASVASFVDFYRPSYALLENVHGMASERTVPGTKTKYNCFSRFLAALVAMGYQTQFFTVDAWSQGSAQRRTRLFVALSAPGLPVLRHPARSHTHFEGAKSRGLFTAPNGMKYGDRETTGPAPFKYISARAKFQDLPSLGDGHSNVCIPYPDHRTSRREGNVTRRFLTVIPRFDAFGNNIQRGKVLGYFDEAFQVKVSCKKKRLWDTKAWSRIDAELPCRTITTTITPACDFTGQWLHYDEHRLLTIQEARRAQSYPDHEILLGDRADQFKIIGNSVDRKVALRLGLLLADSWYSFPPLDQQTIQGASNAEKVLQLHNENLPVKEPTKDKMDGNQSARVTLIDLARSLNRAANGLLFVAQNVAPPIPEEIARAHRQLTLFGVTTLPLSAFSRDRAAADQCIERIRRIQQQISLITGTLNRSPSTSITGLIFQPQVPGMPVVPISNVQNLPGLQVNGIPLTFNFNATATQALANVQPNQFATVSVNGVLPQGPAPIAPMNTGITGPSTNVNNLPPQGPAPIAPMNTGSAGPGSSTTEPVAAADLTENGGAQNVPEGIADGAGSEENEENEDEGNEGDDVPIASLPNANSPSMGPSGIKRKTLTNGDSEPSAGSSKKIKLEPGSPAKVTYEGKGKAKALDQDETDGKLSGRNHSGPDAMASGSRFDPIVLDDD